MERNVALIALFAALIALLGLVPKIDLVSGVPITAQSMGVMLAGSILGARRGFLAAALFLALVAIGLPLLAGGRGGLGVFVGPTAGFAIGFPFAAFATGWLVERWRAPVAVAAFAGSLFGGVVVLYAMGIVGMSLVLGKPLPDAALLATPFLIGDVIKAVLTALVTSQLARLRPGVVLSRNAAG
jgi:biotin transport system substrate-specific component